VNLDLAIEVFVRGYAFGRGFTHPCVAERIEHGIWVVEDAPRTTGEYRNEEYVAFGHAPELVLQAAREHTRGRYKISAIRTVDQGAADLRDSYKAHGCRLIGTEPIMVHRLVEMPAAKSPAEIVRVTTIEQANLLARAARRKQILPEHLRADPPPLRQYMALVDGKPVGWVGSVPMCGVAWCTNMFVATAHRRKGIATALMARMLADDRDAGAAANVLLASHSGARLYATLGYETIGELLLFTPPR
jgi:GNAT superfamily N-acetyltransferase